MTDTRLVSTRTLLDLGPGAQIAMFGFRSSAFGHTRCCCLLKSYNHIFGDDCGGRVLGRLMRLAECLGREGNRPLDLTLPNAIRFTHDEASILSALAAAQSGELDTSRAHLTWLLARQPSSEEINILSDIVWFFTDRSLVIETPEHAPAEPSPHNQSSRPQLALVGHG